MLKKNNTEGVQIFISYRRVGGVEIARNIYERLSLAGYITFFDYHSVREGKFNKQIYTAIEQATDIILVLSKGSLDRCVNEGDWVRTEIEYALSLGKHIILVATDDFSDFPESLPNSIAGIKDFQYIRLSQDYYDESINRLKDTLQARKKISNLAKLTFVTLITLFICFTSIILWKCTDNEGTDRSLSGYTASVYLMRYDSANMMYDNILTDSVLDIFHYEDSISSNSELFVYPKSKVISYSNEDSVNVIFAPSTDFLSMHIPFHYPIIQLKLHSRNRNTIVIDKAFLEIDQFHIDNQPAFRFGLHDNLLTIFNEGSTFKYPASLKCSFLCQGERFTTYHDSLENLYTSSSTQIIMGAPGSKINHLHGTLDIQHHNSFYFTTTHSDNTSNYLTIGTKETKQSKMPIYHLSNMTTQDICLKQFPRSLTKGEVDDDVSFGLAPPCSAAFRIRLRMITSFGEKLYSNYLHIKCAIPNNGIEAFNGVEMK